MTELVLISADNEELLVHELTRIVSFLDRAPDTPIVDVAYSCSKRHGDSVVAIIAEDVMDLRARAASVRDRLAARNVKRIRDKSGTYYFRDHLLGSGKGKLAFVYPGVTSFYPDMLRDLAIFYPECRDSFDELEEAMVGVDGFTPSSFIFPPASYYRHDADIFRSGAYAEALVSIYAACSALSRLVRGYGIHPDGVVGFAGGDLAAMMRSGAAGLAPSRPDRVKMLRDIYHIVYKAVNHGGFPEVAMITAILRRNASLEDLERNFPVDKVTLAVDLSPRQKTYAVSLDYEKEFMEMISAAGVHSVRLGLDRPFNTHICESLVPAIRKFANEWMKHEPICDVYSCSTGDRLQSGLKVARDDIAGRWSKPVLLEQTIRKMYEDGYRVFLEVGPRGLTTSAVEDTLHGLEHAAIALNSIHRRSVPQVQHALAMLVALGAKLDLTKLFERRKAKEVDLDAVLPVEVRRDSEMRLSRAFPRLTLISNDTMLGSSFMSQPKGRGARAAARAAAVAQQARRHRQFDFGAMNPLVSDADTISSSPGVSIEVTKTFRLMEMPFLGDFALGSSQLSYSDPNLKGLILLSLPVAAEIMAEVAQLLIPNRNLSRIEDLNCRRMVAMLKGELTLFVRAERTPSSKSEEVAVKVQLRDDSPNSAYTWPVMEGVFVFAANDVGEKPVSVEPLTKPRNVHWSGRDVYPLRLCCGSRLRGITFVEAWSEAGLDYEINVPQLAGNVAYTRFPIWLVNPLLLGIITCGFPLWRSHEKFTGAFSFPFRMRRLDLSGVMPKEGDSIKCYLRLTGVTPKSHLCDISVTDGNGNVLMSIVGWEELTERVPAEYRDLILQPAMSFLTSPLSSSSIGDPATDVASAFVTDVPYAIFERNEELWLKTLSHVILSAAERKEFREMTGSTSRRVEWLFGRVAAKEAVRRFLKDYYQARWSDADIRIWADDSGKPHAIGAWGDYLNVKLDIAIAHTAQFVVAVAAANARVGVDVESVNRNLSEEFAQGVFTPDEQELAAQAVNSAQAMIKFWCAKEAVSKALGTGIRYSPREMVVTEYIADTGSLTIRLEGAWAEAFKNFKGRDIVVTVRTMREHALASCFIPMSLFGSEL